MPRKKRPFEKLCFNVQAPLGFPVFNQELCAEMVEAYVVAAEHNIAINGNTLIKNNRQEEALILEFMNAGMRSIYTLLCIKAGGQVKIINAK